MGPELEINLGIEAWRSEVLLAIGAAIVAMRAAEPRSISRGFLSIVALIGLAVSLLGLWPASLPAARILSAVLSILFLFLSWIYLRSWLRFSPRQVHQELGQPVPKTRREKQVERASKRGSRAASPKLGAASKMEFGLLLVTGALLVYLVVLDAATWKVAGANLVYAVLALLATSTLWGLLLVSTVEITFFSSPDEIVSEEMPHADWKLLSRLSLLAFAVCFLLSCLIFWQIDSDRLDASPISQIVPVLFAIAWVVLACIAWIIPFRIERFQKQGEAKEWTSLTLAAWIALVSFSVVILLPQNWPWSLL